MGKKTEKATGGEHCCGTTILAGGVYDGPPAIDLREFRIPPGAPPLMQARDPDPPAAPAVAPPAPRTAQVPPWLIAGAGVLLCLAALAAFFALDFALYARSRPEATVFEWFIGAR